VNTVYCAFHIASDSDIHLGFDHDSVDDGGQAKLCIFIGGFIFAFVIAVILGAFYQGYMLKILRREKPLPPVTDFGILFTD